MAFQNLKATGIKYVLTKLKDVFLQIKDAVRTVNGYEADENGNVQVITVPYAQNLQSESSQRNVGTFINRTSGGTSSVETGDGWLMNIKGNSVHVGYVPEVLEMTVSPIDPNSGTAISATIDRNVFVDFVDQSSTITLLYANSWSSDPEDYGITIEGTPVTGDSITIVYVKEERGTITVATPTKLITTGWNLYKHTSEYSGFSGFAQVLKYSDDFGFMVSGTYGTLKFSATIDGTKSDITVIDGAFDIPSDGYVWVTNGNSSDTAIWMTWSDWTEGYNGEFSTYVESEVDFSSVMSEYFADGLLKAGSVRDEIDFNIGQAISRVEVFNYSEEARTVAEESGREYEFDENYIYLARSTAVTHSISVSGAILANDHGMEMFVGTDVEVNAQILYGSNLKNKLERDVLTISAQNLTDVQKAQVQANIGVSDNTELEEAVSELEETVAGLSFAKLYSLGSPTKTITFAGSVRFLLFSTHSSTANGCGCWLISGGTTTCVIKELAAASVITVSYTAPKLKIQTSSGSPNIFLLVLSGDENITVA